MKTGMTPAEIPSGLLRKVPDTDAAINNIELRTVLDRAVDEADLNVTERMALNKKFFPNGGGFDLFPANTEKPQFNMYYGTGQTDEFTREVEALKIPDDVCMKKVSYIKSSKSNFQQNLDNAITKLGKVLKGNLE